jgi:hypothetical protein
MLSCQRSGFWLNIIAIWSPLFFLGLMPEDHQIVPIKNLLLYAEIGDQIRLNMKTLITFLLENFHWFLHVFQVLGTSAQSSV